MSITPGTSPPKRARLKKPAGIAAVPMPPAAKRTVEPPPRTPPRTDELRHMIATAAYYLAAERGFVPGGEMDDWLAAEQKILAHFV